MKNKRGFTLVEIMIVVAIIALLAAIAIPNLLGARRTANQAAARSNLRTLASELEVFAAGDGDGAYPASAAAFIALPSAAAARYCGATCIAATGCGGYTYDCTTAGAGPGIVAGEYTITATPISAQAGALTFTVATGGQMTEAAFP